MTHEELREILTLLEAQGWNPQLCDTPVPYYDNAVPCGKPTDVGDVVEGDYLMLPHDLVERNSIVIVRAKGDSMIDAGIEDGDEMHMQVGVSIRDGDQVVAYIDGESTLKSYFRDSDGTVWLVACNNKYDAIEVTEDMDVRILGKVVKCVKNTPRIPQKCPKNVPFGRARDNISPKNIPIIPHSPAPPSKFSVGDCFICNFAFGKRRWPPRHFHDCITIKK